jgi:hypothetical protein
MVRGVGCLLMLGWLLAAPLPAPLRAVEPPPWLPRYDLDIVVDPAARIAQVKQRVTFINRHKRPATDLVFNAHGRYTIPDGQVGITAKMAEMLRVAPREAFYFDGPPLDVKEVYVIENDGAVPTAAHGGKQPRRCEFDYGAQNPCSIIVPLAQPVGPGESVTVELNFVFRIPNKKGRWSHWEGITTLAQWLPTLAVYDEEGWHALPFIPWHQPFYNEAGVYTARVTLPPEEKLACPMPVRSTTRIGGLPPSPPGTPGGEGRGEGGQDPAQNLEVSDGSAPSPSPPTPLPRSTGGEGGAPPAAGEWIQYDLELAVLRDFSLTCSARYQLTECEAGKTKVRCFHLPEHEHYAKIFTATACQALPVYERWFGPYPYAQFTIAEASFGWNGNECSAMVLIDDRMFNMPHMAKAYPYYLLQHELCHQWFYNIIGTNGYGETFMDEGLATHFSHKLADTTLGRNNPVIDYPKGLGWMPNIHREDLRFYSMVGSRARGEIHPTVQPIDKFGHLAALLANTYDRGGKIFGQIEARLGGDEAMLDFMRGIYRKYAFQIFRVADLQKELELYTGRSWDDFFAQWVHGPGMCDWKIDRVDIDGHHGPFTKWRRYKGPVQVTVDLLEQQGFPEPTVLGIQYSDIKDRFDLRIPIDPTVPVAEFPEYDCRVESRVIEGGPHGRKKYAVRVILTAPCAPRQIVVDPDRVLLDCNSVNNSWGMHIKWRPTPLYTMLDEVEVTNSYDRWSVIFGPWIGTSTMNDPWYTRSPLFGAKIGVVRIQELIAGGFLAYRTNDRNIVAGAEALWSHVLIPQLYFGANLERALTTIDDSQHASRAALFARYVMTSSSSLYLPPFEYVEAFGSFQEHPFPNTRTPQPGANPFFQRTSVGLHYHKYYLTPYWDAEGGVALDASYQLGVPILGMCDEFQLVQGQFSTVKSFPDWIANLGDNAVTQYLKETRFAFRVAGGAATPQNGQLFSLGGGDHFRGFDIAQRQGSLTWLGSIEWRVPILQNCKYDYFDHLVGIRNVYLAPFYDVGQIYLNGKGVGGDVAQALGLGLRVDAQWLGIIERTMLRLDVAQAIRGTTGVQVWVGIQHPF